MNTIRLMDKSSPTFWQSLVAWDSLLFFTICTLDMLLTVWWVHQGMAKESNPWLAACLRQGPLCFCAVKSLSFVPVLAFCAYYRAAYPRFIPLALRCGLTMYAAIYFGSIAWQFLG
ncbi:MAG TPA: DUF5658 family protein [Capsulimonadaceae bacterium]|nr:DUF5658 family protein [Capsulimonadaceae bacterium]